MLYRILQGRDACIGCSSEKKYTDNLALNIVNIVLADTRILSKLDLNYNRTVEQTDYLEFKSNKDPNSVTMDSKSSQFLDLSSNQQEKYRKHFKKAIQAEDNEENTARENSKNFGYLLSNVNATVQDNNIVVEANHR